MATTTKYGSMDSNVGLSVKTGLVAQDRRRTGKQKNQW